MRGGSRCPGAWRRGLSCGRPIFRGSRWGRRGRRCAPTTVGEPPPHLRQPGNPGVLYRLRDRILRRRRSRPVHPGPEPPLGMPGADQPEPGRRPARVRPAPASRRRPVQGAAARHIRLRTNVRDESAQHFSHGTPRPVERVGVGGGLWASKDNDRLFFATADKPNTAGPGSPGGSRLEAHQGKDRAKKVVWKVDACKDVWNPQLLELLVAVKQDDDPAAAWAALAHQRRSAAAHFADPVTL
ncbi:RNaseH domain-containing protein, partial [Streptomyces sp. NPDC060131]